MIDAFSSYPLPYSDYFCEENPVDEKKWQEYCALIEQKKQLSNNNNHAELQC